MSDTLLIDILKLVAVGSAVGASVLIFGIAQDYARENGFGEFGNTGSRTAALVGEMRAAVPQAGGEAASNDCPVVRTNDIAHRDGGVTR